jgi:hypothetical protein
MNILKFIINTKGNGFGSFMLMEWESWMCNKKSEDDHNYRNGNERVPSFLVTLKNRHSIPLQEFALKDEKKQLTVLCDSRRDPPFEICSNGSGRVRVAPAFGDHIYVSKNFSATHASSTFGFHIGIPCETFRKE